jgi:hypothetical protein
MHWMSIFYTTYIQDKEVKQVMLVKVSHIAWIYKHL